MNLKNIFRPHHGNVSTEESAESPPDPLDTIQVPHVRNGESPDQDEKPTPEFIAWQPNAPRQPNLSLKMSHVRDAMKRHRS